MKRLVFLFLIFAAGLSAATYIYEASNQDMVEIPIQTSNYQLLNLEFTVAYDAAIAVTYANRFEQVGRDVNGWYYGIPKEWIEIDDEAIEFTRRGPSTNFEAVKIYYGATWYASVVPGTHSISLMVEGSSDKYDMLLPGYSMNCLQVMVIESDPGSTVNESGSDRSYPQTTSFITSAPSIIVQGCSEVYDVSGQRVNCDISGGVIQVGELPRGTYFARTDEQTVKIVKVD